MSTLAVSRIRVAVDASDADGVLVLRDGALVAVLIYLDEPFYEGDRNRWYLEAGFGCCGSTPATFENLGAALHWVAARLGLEPESVTPAIAHMRPRS